MKKIMILTLAAAATMTLSSCGTAALGALGQVVAATAGQQTTGTTTNGTSTGSILGDILGAATNGQTIGNVLGSVLGTNTLTQQQLIGTWTYLQPGVAFTSDNLLAQAGGEVAATTIKEKVLPVYQKVGIKSSNTQMQFKEDGTFVAVIAGKQISGNYTFDEQTSQVVLQTLLFNMTCYAKRNSDGIALLFESSKLLTLLQTMSAMSGNSTLGTIGDLSKNYDGLRLGFDFK
ncbi:MAG: DUF4923 family protein [Prevotella sp.]|nr:DUF4923 family protein [Prevotella sp.]